MKAIVGALILMFVVGFAYVESSTIALDDSVQEVLIKLGEKPTAHYNSDYTKEDFKRGEELIFIGKTTSPKGRMGSRISKFFTCVSCHNTVDESADLTKIDLEEKLDYSVANNLPFLQGSTFKGIVNRTSWYNDDYYVKYGALVDKARTSLAESVQLCAQECSQGRKLKDWELKAILAYYQSIGFTLKDLKMSESDLMFINDVSNVNSKKIALIKSKYMQTNPATFGKIPSSKSKGYTGLAGRSERGKLVYEKACQSCHLAEGESDVILDNSVVTFKWLKKNITSNSPGSFYEIIRNGTYADSGHKEYMPNYTEEKMSNQQVEDLRAYIDQQAK
jgi:mono/diheme cytochrome c family protein